MCLSERDCLHTATHPLGREGPRDRPCHFSSGDNSWSFIWVFFLWLCHRLMVLPWASHGCVLVSMQAHMCEYPCAFLRTPRVWACMQVCLYRCAHKHMWCMVVCRHSESERVSLYIYVWLRWKLCVHVSTQEAGFVYMCFLHVHRCLPTCGWGFSITGNAVSSSARQWQNNIAEWRAYANLSHWLEQDSYSSVRQQWAFISLALLKP